jgi:hypothetical protein
MIMNTSAGFTSTIDQFAGITGTQSPLGDSPRNQGHGSRGKKQEKYNNNKIRTKDFSSSRKTFPKGRDVLDVLSAEASLEFFESLALLQRWVCHISGASGDTIITICQNSTL